MTTEPENVTRLLATFRDLLSSRAIGFNVSIGLEGKIKYTYVNTSLADILENIHAYLNWCYDNECDHLRVGKNVLSAFENLSQTTPITVTEVIFRRHDNIATAFVYVQPKDKEQQLSKRFCSKWEGRIMTKFAPDFTQVIFVWSRKV